MAEDTPRVVPMQVAPHQKKKEGPAKPLVSAQPSLPMSKIVLGDGCQPGMEIPIVVVVDGMQVGMTGNLTVIPGMSVTIRCKSWTLDIMEQHVLAAEKKAGGQ